MFKCTTCSRPLADAPWRYLDDDELAAHWVCPDAVDPCRLALAFDEFLRERAEQSV